MTTKKIIEAIAKKSQSKEKYRKSDKKIILCLELSILAYIFVLEINRDKFIN